MDPLEKKRLANERRLKAIQDQKLRNQKHRAVQAVKIDTEIPTKTVQKNQIKLFDSDGEEENCEDMFKIRPQFEGRNGLQLLEMSSKFESRFKLDERFKDDEDDVKPTEITETDEEKDKNIKILESVLGHEVSKKFPEKQNTTKKRCIERFDPEDEETSKYVKQNVSSQESKKKPPKKKKKVEVEEKIEPIPISKERYIEVSSNLKDLFQSSSTFSFSSKFNSNDDLEGNKIFDDLNNPFSNTGPKKAGGKFSTDLGQKKSESAPKMKDIFGSKNIFTFFIREDDATIKEGLDSFVRSKPLEEIRESWTKKKDNLTESYRMKKKSYSRRLVNKKPTTQGKRTFIKK